MISARIRKQFPGFSLDVEFSASSAVTALFGPSGAGKTLTLDSIAGFVKPDEGRILLSDKILFDAQAAVDVPPRRRGCGYVFQNYALFPHMTLRDNLRFAAEHWGRLERHRRVNEMVEQFRLTDVAERKPQEVSGGQKQRCSIARALIVAPKLLLLDEPARGLDATLRAELYAILRQVRADFGTPILLVTHSLEECFELADEMLILREGRIVQSGRPAQIAAQPENLDVARLLGIYNILPVEIRALDPGLNVSVLRYKEFDIDGRYYPGRLRGDRVQVCVAPCELRALPRTGKPGRNQVAARLERAIDMHSRVRLEFEDNLVVEISRECYERSKHNSEWVVEFTPSSLRVI